MDLEELDQKMIMELCNQNGCLDKFMPDGMTIKADPKNDIDWWDETNSIVEFKVACKDSNHIVTVGFLDIYCDWDEECDFNADVMFYGKEREPGCSIACTYMDSRDSDNKCNDMDSICKRLVERVSEFVNK